MPSDRPSIEPISTTNSSSAAQHPRPEIATKSLPPRIVPGLPSPPLSPLQFHGHGNQGNGKRLSMLSFPSQPLMPLPEDSTPTVTPIDKGVGQRFEGGYLSGEGEEVDTSVPMLPSQLRRRHESMRRQRSASMQLHSSSRSGESTAVSYSRHSMANVESSMDNHSHKNKSSHTTNTMELTPSSSSRILASQGHSSKIVPMSYFNNGIVGMSTASGPEMPTRDWVKMQCKIQALETEVSHVSRTNSLLNQELDKVTSHLSRLLNSETDDDQQQVGQSGVIGARPVESWRREYEFLVQQVDLMHRQLQLAQSEQHARARFGMEVVSARSEDHSELTQQLYSEVKDLTASLKMWQTAFQQADEKYRRKCDGERVLKETLRDRETQLTTLVDKLSGCESEFRKSISNYDEMMRLSAEIDVLKSQQASRFTTPKVSLLAPESSQDAFSSATTSSAAAAATATVDDNEMPGSFPEQNRGQSRRRSNTLPSNMASPTTVEQVSVSILSWATLLATYMLS
ncbi:hypothetical protein BG015_005074 [Linnemannia schmuckeri]|uniref:Uncharacterized protein n=1 Tax=Linnemannia schmuckeri TaxID=64567 RepID=A0A9P5UXQ9_9FUNG|nr:hypothetical protein BG015_005074 [Linnemannia schmuckeri]